MAHSIRLENSVILGNKKIFHFLFLTTLKQKIFPRINFHDFREFRKIELIFTTFADLGGILGKLSVVKYLKCIDARK